MNTELEKVRLAMYQFTKMWEQGLKDCGLWAKACEIQNALIDLETAINREGRSDE